MKYKQYELVIRPQKEFPLLEKYKQYFPITDNVIFAYDHVIYSNSPLSPDLIVHEMTHFKQQDEIGLDTWVDLYLNDIHFRTSQEQEAYRKQINSLKNREERFRLKNQILSHIKETGLYGDITITL